MRYKALINFCGPISMHVGETRDIANKKLADELVTCKYIEALKDTKAKSAVKEGKTSAPETEVKTNENKRADAAASEAVCKNKK